MRSNNCRRAGTRPLIPSAKVSPDRRVVDASQGVEAQTLANVYQALDNNLEIVPVLNKVDLPAAEPEKVKQQIEDVIGLDASDAILKAPTIARHNFPYEISRKIVGV